MGSGRRAAALGRSENEDLSEERDGILHLEAGEVRKGFLGLFRDRNFSLLWSSSLASQLGDHLNLMALTALIFSMGGGEIKGLEFSKILLLASAPVLIFGPISGVYADRHNRKTMMIVSDILGIFQAFTPKFVKKYANLGQEMLNVFEAYIKDVREGNFPAAEHSYKMVEGELDKLQDQLKK